MNRVLQSLRRRVASCENTADITSNQSGDITNNSDDILAKQVTPLSRDDHSTNDKLGAQVLDNIKKEELLKNLPKGMNTSEISKYICEYTNMSVNDSYSSKEAIGTLFKDSEHYVEVLYPPNEFLRISNFSFIRDFNTLNSNLDSDTEEPKNQQHTDLSEYARNNKVKEQELVMNNKDTLLIINNNQGITSNNVLNFTPNIISAFNITSLDTLPFGLKETNFGHILIDDPYSLLPLLHQVIKPEEHIDLLRQKLRACCIIFNFNNNSASLLKEKKRETLLELVEYISNNEHIFQECIVPDVLLMISSNIFRSFIHNCQLASNNLNNNNGILNCGNSNLGSNINNNGNNIGSLNNTGLEYDEDEQSLEPSWPHLLVVYEFFLRFVISSQFGTKIAKKYIDNAFILKLIDLFQSYDPRERDYLKTILHRIYGKIMPRRSCIRKAMKHIFLRVIIDGEPHRGIAELLEIFVSIVNGFTIPLKEEHKIFLETALIPLHKAKCIASFHQQLIYCLVQYIEKDTKLSVPIIKGMLRYWPITNSSKQILFLNELEELLEITPTNYIEPILVPIFERLAFCIQSPHFHVAERVLYLWNNEVIVNLINTYKGEIYPVLVKALASQNKKIHWNSTVHGLTFVVNKVLAETDPALFAQITEKNNVEIQKSEVIQQKRDDNWKQILNLAQSKQSQIN
ncbi:protein phosphatase 2A regulatory B subunit [Cryptosporidium andersoni]|uniref:Protein phosphatase 2A regulatory B subunit n=1 Tax=Cryptosporidium andersoni TaxID=117008 RepID=A0A1J4MH17_9CRYT|nr:protein phosphatase 2A regulatory B subunit [Cryptosporidium andersoni]